MDLVPCPEEEPGWQSSAPLGEPGGERVIAGHTCCLLLPPGWLLPPRGAPEDAGAEAPGTVFPADGAPALLWELLPALSQAASWWLGPGACGGLGKKL